MKDDADVTALLLAWSDGDQAAASRLIDAVYDELRRVARRHLRGERDHSLAPTALVHEAYLKLADSPGVRVQNRGHFLGLASRVMRHLLVDHARTRRAAKRGQGIASVQLEEATWISDDAVEPVIELDEALQRLAALDERRSRILEQRYFGGLSLEEVAEALDVSLATVKRELRAARAWLAVELTRDAS